MTDKTIWEHLSKELAKANTLVDLSLKMIRSTLFLRGRYQMFAITILDSHTRSIVLSIYNLFDEKFSWSLYSLPGLLDTEKNKVSELQIKAKKHIDTRNEEVGHSSRKVKLEKFKRFQWLPKNELEEIENFFKEISRFLNSYGMRKFNEGYTLYYGGPDTSLQCLIEDLEKIDNEKERKPN